MSAWANGGKRLFDLMLGLLGLAFFAIPLMAIALGVLFQPGRPILFRQIRVGRSGTLFSVWKFRTMTAGGEVTRFGLALRRTAMDELPQLFNILKGEMSFAGPRPLVPEELTELHRIPDGPRRLTVRPGLTGLAQISAAKMPALAERIRWDLVYVDRCSLPLDLKILLHSVAVTLRAAWERPGPKISSGEPS